MVGPSPDMAAALDLRKALEQESGDTGKSEETGSRYRLGLSQGAICFHRKSWSSESIGGGQGHGRLLQGWDAAF